MYACMSLSNELLFSGWSFPFWIIYDVLDNEVLNIVSERFQFQPLHADTT